MWRKYASSFSFNSDLGCKVSYTGLMGGFGLGIGVLDLIAIALIVILDLFSKVICTSPMNKFWILIDPISVNFFPV
jgi:hypothetical protein